MIKDSNFYKFKNTTGKVLIYLGLILYSIWILLPFSIVLVTSFKSAFEVESTMEFVFWPKEWVFTSYENVFGYNPSGDSFPVMISGLFNTLLYVVPTTLVGLFSSSLAAFAFAKLRFKGSNFLFSALLFTMLIPGTITITPTYVLYDLLGWTDSPLPLIIPGLFGSAACVFFMKQFYSGIPTELVEAAKLDGLGFFGIFFRIIVPLSLAALFAQGVLGFVGGYNDYFGPLIYLQSPEYYTLQLSLKSFATTFQRDIPTVMAGSVVAMIPTIVLYLIAQKYFIEGIATSVMKL